MGRAEVLRQLPGAFGDPFRALDALPGVTPIVSGLPFFYVRGAPPANVGYFLGGGRGTALVAGRYSYTAAIRSLIAKDTRLGYRDYEARVTCEVTPDDRLSLLTFGSYNLVARTAAGIESVLFASEFYRLDTR